MAEGIRAMCPDCGRVFEGPNLEGFGFRQDDLTCSGPRFSYYEAPMKLQTCPESLFWYWINERHRIYLRRAEGNPKPWTTDPIFQKYKFVNVFRRLDRTTAWLIENFIEPYHEDIDVDLGLLAFNICWFRMFNRWETGAALGWQKDWDEVRAKHILSKLDTVFTGAYIIHSDPGESKLISILRVCTELYHASVAGGALETCVEEENSLQAVSEGLQKIPHVGPFMAYQMVLDMMYTPALLANAVDRNTWTCTGPGAMRGLRRLDPGATMKDSLERMRDLQARSNDHLEVYMPAMDIHDIEFCLCELDKYCRVKFGEGRPRSTYPGA
jgi:5-hmdU DNA kinase-like protein